MPRLGNSHTTQATPMAQQDLNLFSEPPANRVSGIVKLTGLLVSSELPSRRYQIQQSQTLRQPSTLLLSLRVAQRTTLLPLTTPASMTILLQRANSVIWTFSNIFMSICQPPRRECSSTPRVGSRSTSTTHMQCRASARTRRSTYPKAISAISSRRPNGRASRIPSTWNTITTMLMATRQAVLRVLATCKN